MGAKSETAVDQGRSEIANRILPIFDLSAARGNDLEAKRLLARRIDHAFSTSGFFYVTNHGIAQSVIDDAFGVAADFFHKPVDEKLELTPTAETNFRGYLAETRKYRTFYDFDPDRPNEETKNQSVGGKENYVFGAENPRIDIASSKTGWPSGPNPWPGNAPAFRTKSYTFFEELQRVANDIYRMVAVAHGIDENFFQGKYGRDQDTSLGVYAYYPSLTSAELAAGKQSLPGHADFSALSLVVQYGVGGLQVHDRVTKTWVDAAPIPGTIVVNAGDLLARWSNDRYVSCLHRVMNTAGCERFSFVLGHNPKADAIIDPRELGAANTRYPAVMAGKYMWARMMETGATDEDIEVAKRTKEFAVQA